MTSTKNTALPLIAPAILTALVACGTPEEQRYELKGQVVSMDSENGTVTVDHQEIVGFMGAMSMPFPLKDTWAFDQLQPGDGLNAILVVRGQEYWLEQVVISHPPALQDAESVVPPRLGEPVPDVELVNQDGTPTRIGDYRGKALLVTFIYTRCPLADFCPRMTQHFGVLEDMLRSEPDLYQKTHLLTISFDPDYDTPEKLKEYAVHQPGTTEETLEHWEFATGSHENIVELASFLQFDYAGADDQIMHNLRTAIVAPDGTLFKVYMGNQWKPEELLEILRSMTLADQS